MGIKLKTEEGLEFSFDTVKELMDFKKKLDAEESSKEPESTFEKDSSEDEIKVEVGDKVRIVSSEDGTDTPYHYHDVGSVGKVVSLQQYGRVEVEIDNRTQYLLSHHYEKLEIQGDAGEHEFKVGDKVEVVGNRARHDVDEGEVREITRVDSEEPKYNLSKYSCGSWANTEDIELVEEEQKDIEYGDIVYVKESITDSYGDTVEPGTFARVGILDGRLLVSGVLLENDSIADNLVLVAKEEHTLI